MILEYVKVPQDRVGALVGREGSTKKRIEEKLEVELEIDQEGEVTVEGVGEDPLAEWKARDIVKAIARGMNPEKAILLASDRYVLEVIPLNKLLSTRREIRRQKGRIIGTSGKTRKFIEETTSSHIAIKGKSVAIVGEMEEVDVAKEAVLMLAEGKPHKVVYKYLQDKKRELKEKRMLELWEEPGY